MNSPNCSTSSRNSNIDNVMNHTFDEYNIFKQNGDDGLNNNDNYNNIENNNSNGFDWMIQTMCITLMVMILKTCITL
jgi:hypothetical protein